MMKWVNDRLPQDQTEQAFATLYELFQVVHNKHLIAYYQETGQELDKALQIFIRMNDGGTPLSHSDLLLSVAVAQWTHYDARQEIHRLVDDLNQIGTRFSFSKDLVLKAGLMLSDIGSVGFKVDNFNRENMSKYESNWDEVKRALTLTVQLIDSFGFSAHSLTAHNAILPIAYYLHKKNPGDVFLSSRRFSRDRAVIREWLVRSLLKSGVWGSGLDTLLTEIRRAISESDKQEYPVGRIREAMARRGKQLVFDTEEIEDLVDMPIGGRLTFALLSLVFDVVDLQHQFHVDHVFPTARFTNRRLKKAEVPEEKWDQFKNLRNRLPNLQLLHGTLNREKSDTMPADWLASSFVSEDARHAYEQHHMLSKVPEAMTEFDRFYEERRKLLRQRIVQLLGTYEAALLRD